MTDTIEVRGARQHNLQDITLSIPRNSLTVVTGLSGSGKSSLAFDTIYAEGQRRYVETLSPYARQFLEQLERPDVDAIDGLSPALSIEQKTSSRNPRSTVGTVTEVYDYLRLLFSSIGTPYCVDCNLPIERQPSEQVAARILERNRGENIMILAPCVRGRKGHYSRELQSYARKGFVTARIDGQMERLDEFPLAVKLRRNVEHTIEVVVDRVEVKPESENRIRESIRTASGLAGGLVLIVANDGAETLFSESMVCVQCGASRPDLEPRSFSFNSRFGACEGCRGVGRSWELDPKRLVLHGGKPLFRGNWPETADWREPVPLARGVARRAKIKLSTPWQELTADQREWLLYGQDGKLSPQCSLRKIPFAGLIPYMTRRLRIGPGYQPALTLQQYMSNIPCRDCSGHRLRPESVAVRIAGDSIVDMSGWPLSRLSSHMCRLELDSRKQLVAERILGEIRERLEFLCNVGLGYLSLDRSAATLSGGEAQRVRLATQIGTRLKGVLYVLDEPSIGLHSRDHGHLLDTLLGLRDLGNTVVVVEHDQATIERADHVVDLGPGAGRLGGKVTAVGTPAQIRGSAGSLTGDYLAGRKMAHVPHAGPPPNGRRVIVRGARQHNLKNIDVEFPLGNLCVVTGVSGSGKSTLINSILYPALAKQVDLNAIEAGDHDRIDGIDLIDKVVRIDQTPIGRTPRSNPATYTGAFTPIREFYSMLPESRARGFAPGRFSFNVAGGRCDDCSGDGLKRIEMNFLPDVFVECETCHGLRYNHETLEVRYKGYSIADLLAATVDEVLSVMANLTAVRRKLATLVDVGLGYIQLGQSSTTISGGEAQRMKLARELSKRKTGQTVYVLDEPTTGLHFDDVRKLLLVLRRLVENGNTVIVIEHQLDVIRSADWIVDLGPEGGQEGGRVVCCGPPSDIAAVAGSHTGEALRGIGL
ncbi:MAG: excinuclease ABC subunit UvrA [Bryobacterales bacterium]|nr:excinuclease ABC subunit UvrA [Bryobacterales bacterium]